MELSRYHYEAYGLRIGSDIRLSPLSPSKPVSVDLTIRRGPLPHPPPLTATKVYRAGLNARFAGEGSDCLWLDWSPIVAFLALNGNELLVDTTQTDDDLIALFSLSEALGLILFQRGYFLLHGSAVRIGDEGVVFVGEPGAGKSTTVAAFAQQGYGVISDDMVCIQVTKTGELLLIPAFSQIKIWETAVAGLQLHHEPMAPVREGVNKFSWHDSIGFTTLPVPLKQIFVLTPPTGSAPLPEQLPQSQVPVELLRYFPLPDALLQGHALKTYFEMSAAIARTVPVSTMSRPANFAKLQAFVEHLKTSL